MIDPKKCKKFMAHHEGLNPEQLSSVAIYDHPDQVVFVIDPKTKKTYEFYQTSKTLKLWNQPKPTIPRSMSN